jgi:hypothetical protein
LASPFLIRILRSCACRLIAFAACAAGAQTVGAQDLPDLRAKESQICASYGPGFVAGHEPGHCVKVQERLRVAPEARRAALDEPAAAFAPAPQAPMRDRLRLNGAFSAAPR